MYRLRVALVCFFISIFLSVATKTHNKKFIDGQLDANEIET